MGLLSAFYFSWIWARMLVEKRETRPLSAPGPERAKGFLNSIWSGSTY